MTFRNGKKFICPKCERTIYKFSLTRKLPSGDLVCNLCWEEYQNRLEYEEFRKGKDEYKNRDLG